MASRAYHAGPVNGADWTPTGHWKGNPAWHAPTARRLCVRVSRLTRRPIGSNSSHRPFTPILPGCLHSRAVSQCCVHTVADRGILAGASDTGDGLRGPTCELCSLFLTCSIVFGRDPLCEVCYVRCVKSTLLHGLGHLTLSDRRLQSIAQTLMHCFGKPCRPSSAVKAEVLSANIKLCA